MRDDAERIAAMVDFFRNLIDAMGRTFTDGEIILIGFTALVCLIIFSILVWADRREESLRKSAWQNDRQNDD